MGVTLPLSGVKLSRVRAPWGWGAAPTNPRMGLSQAEVGEGSCQGHGV